MNFINFLKYRYNKTYMIPIDEIQISYRFKYTRPKASKLQHKYEYYTKYKEFESDIYIDRDTFTLVDGYTSYIIAKSENLKVVPVRFKKKVKMNE